MLGLEGSGSYGALFAQLLVASGATVHEARIVALPPVAVEELRQHRFEQGGRAAVLGEEYHDGGLVVCYDDGRPWPPESFTPRFAGEMKRLGFPEVHFHVLRHTAVSIALALGTHVKVVQEMAGHHSAPSRSIATGTLPPTFNARPP
ncbi:MAG: hypothetical protein ABI346_08770 [Candidatus Baltobacteraceae bacterium]